MEPNALTRLKRVAGKQTTTLTHYGRKTGKAHEVTIWFVLDDDKPELLERSLYRIRTARYVYDCRQVGGDYFRVPTIWDLLHGVWI